MSKTQRRRRARASREALAATIRALARQNRHAAASLVTEHDWKQLETTLEWLLHVDISSPFSDPELLCPREAWLVVNLASVRLHPGQARNLRINIARVLEGVAKICVFSQVLRSWDDLFDAFWKRLLQSSILNQSFNADDLRLREIVSFMKHKGTHIALQWRDRHFLADDVVDALREFLATPFEWEKAQQSPQPLQVALRFQQCELRVDDLEQFHALLKVADNSDRLCCIDTLRELSFAQNKFEASHLEALSAMLEDPATRRIDSLDLAATTPDDGFVPVGYATCFERVLSAAVRSKAAASSDQGVSISLADCQHLQREHIDAVHNALAHASRPVRGLSFAGTAPSNYGTWLRLSRLVVSPHAPHRKILLWTSHISV